MTCLQPSIIADQGTLGTEAHQTNKNLLLSDDAVVNTRPQLEIHADDVKCSHGSTIGRLDEDALFYLRARGLAEPAARRLLTRAFAAEILDRIGEPALAESLGQLLQEAAGLDLDLLAGLKIAGGAGLEFLGLGAAVLNGNPGRRNLVHTLGHLHRQDVVGVGDITAFRLHLVGYDVNALIQRRGHGRFESIQVNSFI